ncbi:MAG: T9SS type A sorting domain-containing protein [Saprospiraceae bacterium]|nr:T9SS type A sorting domain-containing protein [Saprospiraceae bacterium]
MKTLFSILSSLFFITCISWETNAQNTVLEAPADVVVSREFQFSFSALHDLSNKTFGQLVDTLAERTQIQTLDLVCANFCKMLPCIGYEGFVSNNPVPKPVSNIACDYFNQFYDTAQSDKKYVLDWGLDGYYLNAGNKVPSISIVDKRVLTQDKKASYGSILRIFKLIGTNNEVLLDTQSIWVVDCNYNPAITRALSCFDDIRVYLDPMCCTNISSDLILSGSGPYDCWDHYKVEARSWITNTVIDRDTLKPGVQLKTADLGKDFKFTVFDPITGNSCWGRGQVYDTIAPTILFPDTVKVGTEAWICRGRWQVPRPGIQGCDTNFTYKIRSLDGDVIGNESTGYVITNLALGFQTADIIITDAFGNVARKTVVLKVEDTTPATAVCVQRTAVSITGNQIPGGNSTKLFAESLDEGSFDNCQQKVWFKAIRMDELLGTTSGSNSNNTLICNGLNGDDDAALADNQVYFDDFTRFCCADVGRTIKVVLRVFDIDPGTGPIAPVTMRTPGSRFYGRYNDCLSEVLVQDKSVPKVVAPPDMVVSCAYPLDYTKLLDPNDTSFGRILNDTSSRQKVITRDKVCPQFCAKNLKTGYPGYVSSTQIPPPAPNKACNYFSAFFDSTQVERLYELEWGLDGYAVNACGNANPYITINDLRECGQGKIERIIGSGSYRAIQTIWVVDCDPFYIDSLHCNDSTYSDVIWPNGICNQSELIFDGSYRDLSPDVKELGKPIIVNNADDNCALISIQYVDSIIHIQADTTIKVFRKWIITDWCQYDSLIDPNFGRWTATQTIVANGCDGPEINPMKDTCGIAKIDSKFNFCVGHINLAADVQDICTEPVQLIWSYKIDLNNDGNGIYGGFDFQVGPLSKLQNQNGDTAKFSNNPFADNRKLPFSASGSYPIGTHKILWTLTDKFGNTSTKAFVFTITDCLKPNARCLTGVITVPLPHTGCITIWAKDLDQQSSDNCTTPDDLKFYFDGDPTKTSITICCKDFEMAKAHDELLVNVEMWVEDEGRNTDTCRRLITIQDNQDICPNVVANEDLNTENELFVSPNPNNGTLFINSIKSIDQINVINFTGTVYSSYKMDDHHALTIRDLPSGLYFIESIRDGKKLKSKKVIVFNE